MNKFTIKLRHGKKKLNLMELNSKSIKIKFKIIGMYNGLKFKSTVSFKIQLSGSKVKVADLSISDLDLCDSYKCDSSLSFLESCGNLYCMSDSHGSSKSSCSSSTDSYESVLKKIHDCIKKFILSIKIGIGCGLIKELIFSLKKSKITKMNIKGYIRQHKN